MSANIEHFMHDSQRHAIDCIATVRHNRSCRPSIDRRLITTHRTWRALAICALSSGLAWNAHAASTNRPAHAPLSFRIVVPHVLFISMSAVGNVPGNPMGVGPNGMASAHSNKGGVSSTTTSNSATHLANQDRHQRVQLTRTWFMP